VVAATLTQMSLYVLTGSKDQGKANTEQKQINTHSQVRLDNTFTVSWIYFELTEYTQFRPL
jgi:hypothetical protein